jgi:hypothetical protein
MSIKIIPGETLVYRNEETGYLEFPEITEIKKECHVGLYSPLTRDGTLVVNGFLVTCYMDMKSVSWIHHSFLPLRLACSLNKYRRKHIELNGVHPFAAALTKLRRFRVTQTVMSMSNRKKMQKNKE